VLSHVTIGGSQVTHLVALPIARNQISNQIKGALTSTFVVAWPRYSPTRNVKLPLILWVSDDIAFHSTV
jgi:hypothetical protein